MKNINLLKLVGIFGALAVILGAFGAHMLKESILPQRLAAYQTGVQYHFIHTLALLGVYILIEIFNLKKLKTTFYLFLVGIILFSGSLYLLAIQELVNMNLSWLGPVTPIGGLIFILGWLSLVFTKYK